MLGAVDDAYALINYALDSLAERGMVHLRWSVLCGREMRTFLRDPRFSALIQRIGFVDYWRCHGPPDGYELRNDGLKEINGRQP